MDQAESEPGSAAPPAREPAGAERRRREEALHRLPAAYALALRLRAAGIDDVALADRLGIEPEAVVPLMAVADAKLAALLAASHRVADPGTVQGEI
jgi:hypothetical protein